MHRRSVVLLLSLVLLVGCARPPVSANQIALAGTLHVQPMVDATSDAMAGPVQTVVLVVIDSQVTVPLDAAPLFGTQIAPWLAFALQCPLVTGGFWATLAPRLLISRLGIIPNGGNGSLCRVPGDPNHTIRTVISGDVYTFQIALMTTDTRKDGA